MPMAAMLINATRFMIITHPYVPLRIAYRQSWLNSSRNDFGSRIAAAVALVQQIGSRIMHLHEQRPPGGARAWCGSRAVEWSEGSTWSVV
jgi:hypothetical protein